MPELPHPPLSISTSRRAGLWLILITLLGFSLRLAAYFQGEAFAYFAFGDEIEAYQRALDFAAGDGSARYLSHAHFGHDCQMPGPLWAVFWLGTMRAGGGPHAVALAMLLLNTAVIPLVYLLGRCVLNSNKAGLYAALFTSTQPWVVYYSVGAYNPEVMPFFGVLVMLAAWYTITNEKSRQVFWIGFLPLAAFQFHAAAGPMLLTSILVLWPARRRVHWPAFFCGLLAGILLYLPYFAGDAAQNWENTRRMLHSGGKFSFGCLKALTTPFSLLMSWCPRWTLPDFADYQAMGNAVCGSYWIMFIFKLAGTGAALCFIGGFLKAAAAAWRAARFRPTAVFAETSALWFMSAWLLGPILIYVFSFQHYSSRYALFQIPLLMLLPAFWFLSCHGACRFRRTIATIVVITVLFNIYFCFAFFRYQGQLIAGNEKFVPSFRNLEKVYRCLKADAGKNVPITVDDRDFLSASPQHDARAIALYLAVREKDRRLHDALSPHPSTQSAAAPLVYKLVWLEKATMPTVCRWGNVGLIRRGQND